MAIDLPRASRPRLKSALARVWRGPASVQFGTGTDAWVVSTSAPATLAVVLALCDGTRERREILRDAAFAGVPASDTVAVLDRLGTAGALDDAAVVAGGLRDVSVDERDRLEPEHAALSLLDPTPGAAGETLARRRACWVEIDGESRL